MKIFAILLVGVLSFVAVLAGLLAMTGNLSAETLKRVMSGEPAKLPSVPGAPEAGGESDLNSVAQALKERDAELAKEKGAVDEEKKRTEMAKKDIEAIRSDMKKTLEQIQQSIQAVAGQADARVTEVATSLSQMKPDKAAAILAKLDTEMGAKVIMQLDEKKRGKILDAMPQEDTARLLSAIQQPVK